MVSKPIIKIDYFFGYIYDVMFKFLSGAATGWIAARSLPPRSPDTPVYSLPTLIELNILIGHAYNTLDKLKEKLLELDKKEQENS
jgi:hypothetical protein